MLQNGVSHRCAGVTLSTKGGIAPFWGGANLFICGPSFCSYGGGTASTKDQIQFPDGGEP